MKKSFFALFFLIKSMVLFSQSETTIDTVNLDEITITSIKIRKSDKSVTPMQSMNRRELDCISGHTAADAVKNFSGITLKDYGGIGGLKTVMVRSMGANHTGVFIDNVQFNDVASGQVDLGKISTENTENISLSAGQANNLQQPARCYALASVININSLEPDFKTKNIHSKIAFKIGSFGLMHPFANVQKKLTSNSYFDLSLNYSNAHGKYPYLLKNGNLDDTILTRKNSDIESLNMNASYVHNFVDKSKLLIRLYAYNSERGLPGAIVYYNSVSAQRLWNDDFFTNIQYKTNQDKRLTAISLLKMSQNNLRYLDPEYLNSQGKLDNRYRQREYYFSQIVNFKIIDPLKISYATDFFVNTLNANLYEYANPVRFSWLSVLAMCYKTPQLEVNGNLLATVIREKTMHGNPAPDRNKLNPTVSLGYKIFNDRNIKIRFLYKNSFRMPTFNDLYYTLVGNNNLLPENANQYNLGVTGYFNFGFINYFSVKSDIFYNKITNKIIVTPSKNLFIWSMKNVGIVDIRGIELQTHLKTNPLLKSFILNFQCNYTYQKAIDITSEKSSSYKQQIPYIPYETFSGKTSITYKKISLNYNALFNGYRYVLGGNIVENILPGWWQNDISFIYTIELKKQKLKIKTEINNVFNRQYEVVRNFPMPGRAFYLTLALSY